MTIAPISQWLRQAIEQTQILSKEGWANVLGVNVAMVLQYASGDLVPKARVLRDLVQVVRGHESEDAKRCARSWSELEQLPIRKAHPAARGDALTLAHYIVTPLWDAHRFAVAALPAHEQERLLQNGIGEASRWIIARNRAEAGRHQEDGSSAAPPDAEAHEARGDREDEQDLEDLEDRGAAHDHRDLARAMPAAGTPPAAPPLRLPPMDRDEAPAHLPRLARGSMTPQRLDEDGQGPGVDLAALGALAGPQVQRARPSEDESIESTDRGPGAIDDDVRRAFLARHGPQHLERLRSQWVPLHLRLPRTAK